jgi:hypothetical protein
MVNTTTSPSIMTSKTAKIAAFGALAAILAMAAFGTVPAAQAALIKNVKVVIKFDDIVDIDKVIIKVLSGNKVILKKVVNVENNRIVTFVPIDVTLIEVGNVQICANVISVAGGSVFNACKQVTQTTERVVFNVS